MNKQEISLIKKEEDKEDHAKPNKAPNQNNPKFMETLNNNEQNINKILDTVNFNEGKFSNFDGFSSYLYL